MFATQVLDYRVKKQALNSDQQASNSDRNVMLITLITKVRLSSLCLQLKKKVILTKHKLFLFCLNVVW